MKQFVKKWDLTSNWSFVTGNSDELDQIWSSYFINPQKSGRPIQGGVKGINSALVERQTVIHSSPVYILDKEGTARVVHTNPINPTSLAHDVVQMNKYD
jgi:cytochrome oxidase Cu insertion factor (SCO1/SenC/PrrC family)